MEEEKSSLGTGLKVGLIIVGIVAMLQVVVLGFVFKDEITESVSDLFVSSSEVLTYPLESMQVNLGNVERGNYLRTTIHLEYENKKHEAVLNQSMTQVKATILETLRSKSLSDINTVENTKKLGDEIKDKVNDVLDLDVVSDVYFIEFLYQ